MNTTRTTLETRRRRDIPVEMSASMKEEAPPDTNPAPMVTFSAEKVPELATGVIAEVPLT